MKGMSLPFAASVLLLSGCLGGGSGGGSDSGDETDNGGGQNGDQNGEPVTVAASDMFRRWEADSVGYLAVTPKGVMGAIDGTYIWSDAMVFERDGGEYTGEFGGMAYYFDDDQDTWEMGSLQADARGEGLDLETTAPDDATRTDNLGTSGYPSASNSSITDTWSSDLFQLTFAGDGSLAGSDAFGCNYQGTYGATPGTVYRIEMTVSGCAGDGEYTGAAFISGDDDLTAIQVRGQGAILDTPGLKGPLAIPFLTRQ